MITERFYRLQNDNKLMIYFETLKAHNGDNLRSEMWTTKKKKAPHLISADDAISLMFGRREPLNQNAGFIKLPDGYVLRVPRRS